jgi:hypothetical protein
MHTLFLPEELKGSDHFKEQKCRLQDNIKINLKGTGRRM